MILLDTALLLRFLHKIKLLVLTI